jgi:two-component system, OmpR family, response regulator
MSFKSILYVDDDADICSIVHATLRLIVGLRVSTADSGERAIDLAYEVRPDLVLMDVMMPGLDGPSTFKRMHASALLARIPVIFMTAKVLPVEIAQLLKLGAIGVIVKPFDPLKLYDDLCALWGKHGEPRCPASTGGQVRVQAEVNSLTVHFLARAQADVINLAKLIGLAREGDRSVFKEIERVAHSIHGAGAMFGFPNVSAAGGSIARTVQGLLAGHAGGGSGGERTALLQLLESNRQLARHVEAAGQTAPQSAAMFQGSTAAK